MATQVIAAWKLEINLQGDDTRLAAHWRLVSLFLLSNSCFLFSLAENGVSSSFLGFFLFFF
jgi:hypothetical protein